MKSGDLVLKEYRKMQSSQPTTHRAMTPVDRCRSPSSIPATKNSKKGMKRKKSNSLKNTHELMVNPCWQGIIIPEVCYTGWLGRERSDFSTHEKELTLV